MFNSGTSGSGDKIPGEKTQIQRTKAVGRSSKTKAKSGMTLDHGKFQPVNQRSGKLPLAG